MRVMDLVKSGNKEFRDAFVLNGMYERFMMGKLVTAKHYVGSSAFNFLVLRGGISVGSCTIDSRDTVTFYDFCDKSIREYVVSGIYERTCVLIESAYSAYKDFIDTTDRDQFVVTFLNDGMVEVS